MTKMDKLNFSKIEYQLGYHCAPLIMGLKGSAMISLETVNLTDLFPVLIKMRLEHYSIYQNDRKTILFLFRRQQLAGKLNEEKRKEVLFSLGYLDFSINKLLAEYKKRFRLYKQGGYPFPHEIGLLLEYPVGDVIKFIETGGKGALLNGYWKVYEFKEEAQILFQTYDLARKWIVSFLEKGNMLDRDFSRIGRMIKS